MGIGTKGKGAVATRN